MNTSLIITTYNRADRLSRCLDAALRQEGIEGAYEVILVDDCSTDSTPSVGRGYEKSHSNFRYLRNAENAGSAGSRNNGADVAKGDLLLFVDDDIVIKPDYVANHQRLHLDAAPDRIAVVGNISYSEETFRRSNFGRFMQSRYLGYRSERDLDGIDFYDLPARCFGAGVCSMTRSDFEAIGRWDANIRRYGGEDEYAGYLLKKSGVRLIFGRHCHAVHEDSISLMRHKLKTLELSQSGYRYLMEQAPDYFEDTKIRLLLPKLDSSATRRRKLVHQTLKLALNPAITGAIEWWLQATDKNRVLYCQPLYRAVMAAWTMQGLRAGYRRSPDVAVVRTDDAQRRDEGKERAAAGK